jgi:hypothetical protein
MQRAAAASPVVFQEHMEPLHRMILSHDLEKKSLTDEDK